MYSNHETAFEGALTKCTLPVSERRKALNQLQRMNVTAFSFFGNEESLVETLAYQEIEDVSSQEPDEGQSSPMP